VIRCDVSLLSRYLDAELTLPERRGVEVHLATCTACRSELEAIRRTDRVFRAWASQREPIPRAAEERVLASSARGRRLSSILALGRVLPAALGSSIAALLVLASVNAGIVNTPSVNRQAAGPSRSALEKRSAPLVNARRVSAMLGERAPGQGTVIPLPHTNFNIE
jgi:anti-sigma factor RsiW